MQVKIYMILCAKFSHGARMENVSIRLRELRKMAVPRVTVRAIAAELDLPLGTYSFYESPTKYKKAALPLELTRRIATVLAKHNVDPAEVMKLAGLVEGEAAPEAKVIEASLPPLQLVSLPVALPSEAALTEMFAGLLSLVPPDATQIEVARILAQRLPSGFAAIGPVVIDQGIVHSTANEAVPQFAAKDRPAPARR